MSRAPQRSQAGPNTIPAKPLPPPRTSDVPTPEGRYGPFGGAEPSDTFTPLLLQLDSDYTRACDDSGFWDELLSLLRGFAGRATPLFPADALSAHCRARLPKGDGARIWLKREDLLYTGSACITHALGFALLAAKSGKRRLVAPATGGPHAVAVSAAAAQLGLACEIHLAADDLPHAAGDMARAAILGAKIVEIPASPSGGGGGAARFDSIRSACAEWGATGDTTLFVPPSAIGPHPFPLIVRDFQCIVGRETKAQSLRLMSKLPETIISAVGVGAECAGLFYPFIDDAAVKLVGVEAGGRSGAPGDHAAPLTTGRPGIFLGHTTLALLDDQGGPLPVHSAAGPLAYPVSGPEHAYWKERARVRYTVAGDDEALHAMGLLAHHEGIIASIEASHAVAEALRLAVEGKSDHNIVVYLSGRGDKDVEVAARFAGARQPK